MDEETIRSLLLPTNYTYIRLLGTGTQSSVHLLRTPQGHECAAKIANGPRVAILEHEHAVLSALHANSAASPPPATDATAALPPPPAPDQPKQSLGTLIGAQTIIAPAAFLAEFPSANHATLLLPALTPLPAYLAARAALVATAANDVQRRAAAAHVELHAWAILAQLAQALRFLQAAAPARGAVSHGDVAPANVLVREGPGVLYPRVVLADFGAARAAAGGGGRGPVAARRRAAEDARGVARVVAFACSDGSDPGAAWREEMARSVGDEAYNAGLYFAGLGNGVGFTFWAALGKLFDDAGGAIGDGTQVLEHVRFWWESAKRRFVEEEHAWAEVAMIDELLVD
jgi:hypothetical protein